MKNIKLLTLSILGVSLASCSLLNNAPRMAKPKFKSYSSEVKYDEWEGALQKALDPISIDIDDDMDKVAFTFKHESEHYAKRVSTYMNTKSKDSVITIIMNNSKECSYDKNNFATSFKQVSYMEQDSPEIKTNRIDKLDITSFVKEKDYYTIDNIRDIYQDSYEDPFLEAVGYYFDASMSMYEHLSIEGAKAYIDNNVYTLNLTSNKNGDKQSETTQVVVNKDSFTVSYILEKTVEEIDGNEKVSISQYLYETLSFKLGDVSVKVKDISNLQYIE